MKTLCILFLIVLPAMAVAQWEPEIKLSTNEVAAALNENMGQSLIADGDTLYAVWCDSNKNGSAIYFKRSLDAGTTWGADMRISGSPGYDGNALLAFSSSTLHLVFLRNDKTSPVASYYKHSTDGGATWGPDVYLGDTTWWPGVAAAGGMVYVSLNNKLPTGNSEVYFRRSADNGTTWEPMQQISNAPGRSEDPAIMAIGSTVHLVWNDNRATSTGGGMAVYYRRSEDYGVTWGPETALTQAPAYTYFPTVYPWRTHVDVAYGDRQTGHYEIFYMHSADCGSTWEPSEQMSHTTTNGLYPAMVRDGFNVHMAWSEGGLGILYRHSGDGGATWDPAITLTSQGGLPFLAVQGQAVHMLFLSQRDGHNAIYYKRNLTGNPSDPASAVAPRNWTKY